jgi:hypothetical protein
MLTLPALLRLIRRILPRLYRAPAMRQANGKRETQRDEQPDQADAVSGREVDQIGQVGNGLTQVVERRRKHGVKPRYQRVRQE